MKNNQTLNLLPNYFKKIGIGIIIATFFLGLIHFIGFRFTNDKELFMTMGYTLSMIGLLLYGLAKDEREDELILLLRTRAMATAFLFGALYVILNPILKICFETPELSARLVVFNMLLFYLINFTSQKIRMK